MSKPYTDDDVARLRSFKALRGGEQPDPNEVAYLSRPLRWLATLDASRAAYAALVTERDEAVAKLRAAVDRIGGIAQEARHHSMHAWMEPVLRKAEAAEQWARSAVAPAPGAVDDGGTASAQYLQHVPFDKGSCAKCNAQPWHLVYLCRECYALFFPDAGWKVSPTPAGDTHGSAGTTTCPTCGSEFRNTPKVVVVGTGYGSTCNDPWHDTKGSP